MTTMEAFAVDRLLGACFKECRHVTFTLSTFEGGDIATNDGERVKQCKHDQAAFGPLKMPVRFMV
jgi:hypothetical protein